VIHFRGRVCVVGSVNIDTTYLVPVIPRPGETVLAACKVVAPGGKGANQAAAAAAMGSRVAFVGRVGDDPEAALAIGSLTQHGVDVSQLLRITGAATGTAVILVAQGGENVIAVDPGANRKLTPEAVEAHLAATAYDVILAQLEIDPAVVLAVGRGRRGATFVLNPAPILADGSTTRELLRYTDILVPNRPELGRLVGGPTPVTREELDLAVDALDFDGIVVVTLGAEGAVVYEGGTAGRRRTAIEPVRVETVDTTGAGDVFCGVLAFGLAAGEGVVEAARRANEMASRSTTVVGARAPAGLFRPTGPRPASEAPARPS
jgi:ribokinase